MPVEQELKNYLLVIWRYKWMIAACGIITSIVALGISLLLTPSYSTTAIIRAASVTSNGSIYINSALLTRLTNTLIEIANSDYELDEIARELGSPKRPDVEVEIVPETELINVIASDPDPTRSRDIANKVASKMIEHSEQFYGDSYLATRRFNLFTIVEPASLPLRPSTPKTPLNVALGLFGGVAMGVILAYLFEGMDDTLRGIEDVQSITTLPILSTIPEFRRGLRRKAELNFSSNGHSALAPGFDQLGARLNLSDTTSKPTKLLITSPNPGAGKSTVAANLAVSLTEVGKKIVLVDMDFHRPRIHTFFGLPNKNGLSDYMRHEISLDETLQTTTYPNLQVVVTGSNPDLPPQWLTPGKIGNILEHFCFGHQFILIDSPALLSVADPMVFSSLVDGVILVVAKRKTERQQLSFALQQLQQLDIGITGIVINRVPNTSIYHYYGKSTKKLMSPKQRKTRNQRSNNTQVRQVNQDQE